MKQRRQLEQVAGIVRDVGQSILSGADDNTDVSTKRDGSFVTEYDVKLQHALFDRLQSAWPEIPFIGEEMPEDERKQALREGPARFWCLDPLDGTTNFTSGLPFYGISVALIEQGVPTMGVVYDPNRDECFTAIKGDGSELNGRPLHCASDKSPAHCIACVDFKRLARTLSEHLVAQPPFKSQRNLGASVLEWCWLAANRFQLYLHGGQNLWDYGAGSLVLREAGGRAVTLEGVDIPDPGSSDALERKVSVVAASNPELLETWWSWIAERAELYNLLMAPGRGSGF